MSENRIDRVDQLKHELSEAKATTKAVCDSWKAQLHALLDRTHHEGSPIESTEQIDAHYVKFSHSLIPALASDCPQTLDMKMVRSIGVNKLFVSSTCIERSRGT